jgi:hypothetical protein
MKNSNETIGNRAHDVLFCSAVPQHNAPHFTENKTVLKLLLHINIIITKSKTNAVI